MRNYVKLNIINPNTDKIIEKKYYNNILPSGKFTLAKIFIGEYEYKSLKSFIGNYNKKEDSEILSNILEVVNSNNNKFLLVDSKNNSNINNILLYEMKIKENKEITKINSQEVEIKIESEFKYNEEEKVDVNFIMLGVEVKDKKRDINIIHPYNIIDIDSIKINKNMSINFTWIVYF